MAQVVMPEHFGNIGKAQWRPRRPDFAFSTASAAKMRMALALRCRVNVVCSSMRNSLPL